MLPGDAAMQAPYFSDVSILVKILI